MNRENKFTISYLINNSKKTFHDLPEQKHIAEQIHITHKKKKKTIKQNEIKFFLEIMSTESRNLFKFFQFEYFIFCSALFVSHAASRDSCAVHAAQCLF